MTNKWDKMILKTAFSSTVLEKQTILGSAYMEDVKRKRSDGTQKANF